MLNNLPSAKGIILSLIAVINDKNDVTPEMITSYSALVTILVQICNNSFFT